MIAAIYARKSTEQPGVAEDQRSVTRQVEHARNYAERKGWQVAEEHIYVDDGISGAEFKNRPGLVRLLNALQPALAVAVGPAMGAHGARRSRTNRAPLAWR
jgi:DNA invertase Pin-like site-specific DNA recombinase